MKQILFIIFLCIIAGCEGQYDESGYNMDGYDREGYSIWGYNKSGYNRAGYNREGFNRLGSYNPNQDEKYLSLLKKQNLLQKEINDLTEKYNASNDSHNVFVAGLSDEELKVYQKFISNAGTNQATYELNKRELDKVLSTENSQTLAVLLQDSTNLEIEQKILMEKIQDHKQRVAEHNQNLLAYQQEIIRKQQARQVAYKGISDAFEKYGEQQQRFYQQKNQRFQLQQMNNSLRSIAKSLGGY